jgi:hypothetical protein
VRQQRKINDLHKYFSQQISSDIRAPIMGKNLKPITEKKFRIASTDISEKMKDRENGMSNYFS